VARRKTEQDLADGDKDYRFNTSLARGLSVLKAFGPDNRPIGNAEIAKRVDLPKATVSRLTFTLTELGYLTYDDDIGRYSLGPAVLSLGYDVLAQMEIGDIARPFMQELAEYADGSVFLGMPSGTELVYIQACRSPVSMTIRLGIGSRIPMAKTGMGRSYLAALPEDDRAALLERMAHDFGDEWPEIERKLQTAIEDATARGFAIAEGDWITESNSAGVAIKNAAGYPVYAVNVGGLRSIITRERLEVDLGPRLLAVARQIEHAARAVM
jgi:DNA-binding IclR family transcriptional regulator